MTSSRCQLHPALTCMPGTMRPFGIRARPPLCAARAAATWSELVNETRKVSLATANVTTAPADGAVGVLFPHALAKHVATIAAVMNAETCILGPGIIVITNHFEHAACRVRLDLGISQWVRAAAFRINDFWGASHFSRELASACRRTQMRARAQVSTSRAVAQACRTSHL
jgi:hypothetical protein